MYRQKTYVSMYTYMYTHNAGRKLHWDSGRSSSDRGRSLLTRMQVMRCPCSSHNLPSLPSWRGCLEVHIWGLMVSPLSQISMMRAYILYGIYTVWWFRISAGIPSGPVPLLLRWHRRPLLGWEDSFSRWDDGQSSTHLYQSLFLWGEHQWHEQWHSQSDASKMFWNCFSFWRVCWWWWDYVLHTWSGGGHHLNWYFLHCPFQWCHSLFYKPGWLWHLSPQGRWLSLPLTGGCPGSLKFSCDSRVEA